MQFVNARITKEEYIDFGLNEVDQKYRPMKSISSSWTIDRERNIHLRTVSRNVPPEMGPIKPFHLFFWKSAYVIFECDFIQHSNEGNNWCAIQELTKLEIPPELEKIRAEIIQDIKAALTVRGQETGILRKFRDTATYKLELKDGV